MSIVTPLRFNRNGRPTEQASSSYIERIPLELLAEIFRKCDDNSDETMSSNTFTNLCLTCKIWRDTAFSTPELWSTFKVTITTKTCSPHSLHGLLHRLDRSNTRPLFLSIIFKEASEDHALVASLIAHVHRWRTLYLDVGENIIIPPSFPNDLQASFLRTLHIRAMLPSTRMTSLEFWLVSLISAAPNLYKVVIPYHDWISGSMASSFERLTHLCLTQFVDEERALTIIKQLPQIVECYFSVSSRFSFGTRIAAQTVVCAARSLHIIPHGNIDYFFKSLIMPNLDTFSIYYGRLGCPWHTVEPETFLSRATHQITSFTIRNLFMPSAKLIKCLRHLSPSLVNLNILSGSLTPGQYRHVENMDKLVLDSLTFDPSSVEETLCPYLEKIVLERCIKAEDGMFSRMVKSRLPTPLISPGPSFSSVVRMKFVGVVFRYHTHEEDKARLACMKDDGLDVDVKAGWPRSPPPIPDWT